MSYRLLGLHIKPPSSKRVEAKTFSPPVNQEGALVVNDLSGGGGFGFWTGGLDFSSTFYTDEVTLINRYREMSLYPEVDDAVNDIVNETIIRDSDDPVVQLQLDGLPAKYNTKTVKDKIQAEFQQVLSLLDFNNIGYEIFRQWYVDGRIYYHMVVDENHPENGINEVRMVDPRCIKFVREVRTDLDGETITPLVSVTSEYFIYTPMGIRQSPAAMVQAGGAGGAGMYTRISKDAVAYIHSGVFDPTHNQVLSYLHKAIKPMNQLRMMEDSAVIYRLSRAPERRLFYVDVGNLPAKKAEAYVQGIMQQYRNKLVYDASTGEIRDDRKFMTMLEDFFLPRREGNRGTEVSTLPGASNLNEIEDISYFRKKLYKALNVPYSRTEQTTGYSLGRASEITRDEIKFARFLSRLRSRFSELFDQLMSKQLFLRNVIPNPNVWYNLRRNVHYAWQEDSYYAELKDIEIEKERLNLLSQMDNYRHKYFSDDYFRRKVLRFSADEIEEIDKQIEKEMKEDQEKAADGESPFAQSNERVWVNGPQRLGLPGAPSGANPAGAEAQTSIASEFETPTPVANTAAPALT